MIIIGLDPHKRSHTAVALEPAGRVAGMLKVAADKNTKRRLLAWAGQWPDRRWAVEGANGLGRLVAQQLVAMGENVVDVPAKLASRARLLETGHGNKTDDLDARSIAAVAQRRQDLRQVATENHSAVLRLLSDRRDELNQERRRTINRLHRLLRDLVPGGAPLELSASAAAKILATVRSTSSVDLQRRSAAKDHIADVRRLDRALAKNRKQSSQEIAISGTSLTDILGVSDVLATKILGHVGDVTRFSNDDRFANYSGTAPIEASSGDIVRHRLSRAGNRQLNHALHLAARVQVMREGPGKTYYARKLTESKTKAEALRCLKRQLAKVVYRHLMADLTTSLMRAA